MKRNCPACLAPSNSCAGHGYFIRNSDGRKIPRLKCLRCQKTFSHATTQLCYRQKKRRLNPRIFELLASGVSQRRIAKLLNISRTTVVRKFLFLAQLSARNNFAYLKNFGHRNEIQFDDLETIEHTKCKPLSVALAVEKDTRKIMAFSVSQMPAKGLLAKISRKKYGPRKDERHYGWLELFQKISPYVAKNAVIESDQNPHYPYYVKTYCSGATHITTPGQRGCVTGQGELKKIKYDPLFSLNHTFAMCRANINRLFRKTWCTTKKPERLRAHLEIYIAYHNHILTN